MDKVGQVLARVRNSFGSILGFMNPGKPIEAKRGFNAYKDEYPHSYNMQYTPRSEVSQRGTDRASFDTLRRLAENCDLVRIAIEYCKEQISGLDWNIVPRYKTDKTDYSSDIKKATEFFSRPDKVNTFYDWFGMILEDSLVIDAMTIYRQRTNGNELYALMPVDGGTIKPLIDDYGYTPLSPEPAYQQILYGRPVGSFSTEELIYKPKNRRTTTMYGMSPTEYIMLTVNLSLKQMVNDLRTYTDGNTPEGLLTMPPEWTPEQVAEFQQEWDLMLKGDMARRKSLKMIPAGAQYISTKPTEFRKEQYEWLSRLVALAFGVSVSIFITDNNKATAEISASQQEKVGLMPRIKFYADLFSDIIQNDLGYSHLKWEFEKEIDEKFIVEKNVQYVNAGIISRDEVRVKEGYDPLLKEGSPPAVNVGTELIFLTENYLRGKMEESFDEPEPIKEQVNNPFSENKPDVEPPTKKEEPKKEVNEAEEGEVAKKMVDEMLKMREQLSKALINQTKGDI